MSLNTGIKNEIEIVEHLDSHVISELNSNLKNFVLDIFQSSNLFNKNEIIYAERTNNKKFKPDMIVKCAEKNNHISIKKGSGNSIHQEPINGFIKYIQEDLHATKDVVDCLLFFHWGDGTLDGTGLVSSRMKARDIIKEYPEKIASIQNFFNKNEDRLLERFLSTGVHHLSHVDYLYHGNFQSADWHSIVEVYKNLKANPSNALSVGGLNFQTYGRSLNGQDDVRRSDVQLKWGNMPSFFLSGKKSIVNQKSKIKGDNSHGFRNVENIIESLNNKTFSNIPDNLKEFIFSIFNNKCISSDILTAKKVRGGLKGDILIWLNNNKEELKNISVISGSGNSVHQENVYSFCDFLRDDIGLEENAINKYLHFHFADETVNNGGDVSSRLSARQYKKIYADNLKYIENNLFSYRKQIIERFVKKNVDYPDVDYLLYTNTELPFWAKVDTLIANETKKDSNDRAALAIGDLSIQAWNRSLNGRADHKRFSMQVKWNKLSKNIQIANKEEIFNKIDSQKLIKAHDDMFFDSNSSLNKNDSEIMNMAIQGINFEYKFTSSLNQDKDCRIWESLGIYDNKNVFLVNTSYNQVSKIAGSKVPPKSDCYAVEIDDNISLLLEDKGHILTEELLLNNNISHKILNDSGISIKLPSSKNYTLQKISYSTFRNLFTDISSSYFVAALLFCDPKQVYKNDLILATFKRSIDILCNDLNVRNDMDDFEMYRILKTFAINKIKEVTNTNRNIFNAICFGDEIFEKPYCSSYIFENGNIISKNNYNSNITVTTGSGRSKGTYTLVFK